MVSPTPIHISNDPDKLWLPDIGKEINRPWFLPNEESLRQQHKILTSVFYIVKQGDTFGERLRCVNCNNRHEYITLMCINKPFNGMFSGLYAYYRLVKDNNIEAYLNPGALSRYRNITTMLGSIPNLGSSHPEIARKMLETMGNNDAKLGALSLGILEGIAPREAQILTDRINDKGIKPRYILAKPTPYEIYRAVDYTRRRNSGAKVHWTR